MKLSDLIKDVENIERKVVNSIEFAVSWIRDKSHQEAILNAVRDLATYSVKAIPIIENLADYCLPGETKLIDSVGAAAMTLALKVQDFGSNPTLGTFLQLGGEALRQEIAKILPALSNGIEIGGKVITNVAELNAIDPAVLQSVIHANITSYITSAGAVDMDIQTFLAKLTSEVQQPVSATGAGSQPSPAVAPTAA